MTGARWAWGFAGAFSGILAAAPCSAQTVGSSTNATTPVPVVRELTGQLGASINNAGLQQLFELSWRRATSASKHPLLSDAHIAFGATAGLTPAFVRPGAWVEVAPLSLLVIRAGVEPAFYFGTFDSLTSFDHRTDPFDTDSKRARGGAVSGRSTRFYVTPTLRLRAGRLVGQTSADFDRWSSNVSGPFYYEPTRDTLLDVEGDRTVSLSSAVLYEHPRAAGGRVLAGVTHSLMRVDGASLNRVERLGAVFIARSDGRRFKLTRPSLTVAVWNYLEHPSKSGQWGAAMAIGFLLNRR